MKSPLGAAGSLSLGMLLLRLPLGGYMLIAGFNKIFKVGLGSFVQSSIGMAPDAIPGAINRAYLYTLPFLEFIVGALLLAGLFTRAAALVNAIVLITIIIATGITGGAGPFHHAFVMLGAALAIALIGPGRVSIDGMWRKKPRSKEAHR